MNHQKVLFLDTAQASTKALTLGKASWILKDPIGEMAECQIGLAGFSFVNYFINIFTGVNNVLNYSDDPALPAKYNITFPQGSYSLADLDSYVSASLLQAHGTVLFNLLPNYSTARVAITFNTSIGWYVHFGLTSPFTILGFNQPSNVPVTQANIAYEVEYGPNVAAFNNIESLKITTNLSNDSVSNTTQSAVIYTVTPTASVGSTERVEPNTILWLNSPALQSKTYEIAVQIFDQNDVAVYFTENFTLTILAKYRAI